MEITAKKLSIQLQNLDLRFNTLYESYDEGCRVNHMVVQTVLVDVCSILRVLRKHRNSDVCRVRKAVDNEKQLNALHGNIEDDLTVLGDGNYSKKVINTIIKSGFCPVSKFKKHLKDQNP